MSILIRLGSGRRIILLRNVSRRSKVLQPVYQSRSLWSDVLDIRLGVGFSSKRFAPFEGFPPAIVVWMVWIFVDSYCDCAMECANVYGARLNLMLIPNALFAS